MKHFKTLWNNRSRLLHRTAPHQSTGSRRSNGHCSRLSSMHLVMTGHNAQRPRTGRERGLWWRLSEASYLTVWTLNDRFFASLVYCMLRRVLSDYWRKETEKSKVFLWGGRFGWSLLCSGSAEKETRGSLPTTGCLPVDRNQLGPDSLREFSLIASRPWQKKNSAQGKLLLSRVLLCIGACAGVVRWY